MYYDESKNSIEDWLKLICFSRVKNRFSLFWKRIIDDLSSIGVSAVFEFSLVLIAVINGPVEIAPSNWRQKKARQRLAHAFLFKLFLCAIFHILNSA